MDLLDADRHRRHCPYKGEAEWWSVRAGDSVHQDLAWSYRTAAPESQKIAGLVGFYDEKVDVYVDGVLSGATLHQVQLSRDEARLPAKRVAEARRRR